jgi:protein O-mannosyl-transferase
MSEKRIPTVPSWSRHWLGVAFLFAATFLVYQEAWHAGFIWDDDAHLTRNPCIIGPLGFKDIWTSSRAYYYPLVLTSFWVLHKLVGLSPLPYHLLNVFMHAISAVVVWRVLRHLGVRGAWIGAAIWALHPVQVESVAWITELKNTQSCFFYLLSILFFLWWHQLAPGRDRHRRALSYGAAFACAVLAILSKSSTVMLPVVLGLCLWWMDGRWRWRNITALVPFLLISAAAAGWTIWEQKVHSQAAGGAWLERVIIAGRDVWFYLGKLVWPHPLIFIYPRWEVNTSHLLDYLPTLAAVGALIALWWSRNGRMRPLFFAAAYFVISLFPVLDFFDVYFFRYSFVGDHLQYLASIGPLALLGATITIPFGSLSKGPRLLKPALCGALLCVLGLFSWKQTRIYHSPETLWDDTLAKNPGWMAHDNYAEVLLGKGKIKEALAHFQQALESNPDNVVTHSNLGYALLVSGQVNESLVHLQRALKIDPNYEAAHFNMANTLLQMGRVDQAVSQLQTVLNIDPYNSEAQKNMAWVLATCPETYIRDGAKAVDLAERARKIESRDPIYGATLAAAYAEVGRFSNAIETAKGALQSAIDAGNMPLADGIRAHIELYRAGRPFRDIRPSSDSSGRQ